MCPERWHCHLGSLHMYSVLSKCTVCCVHEKFMKLHRDENKLDVLRGRLTQPSFIEDGVQGESSVRKSFSCFNLKLLFSFLTLEICKGSRLFWLLEKES